MLTLTFTPATDDPSLVSAATDYRTLWAEDGERIVACLERLTGLSFAESSLEATIIEAVSQSHPLRLRASYPSDVKRAALIHELCHRLLTGRPPITRALAGAADRQLEVHKLLNLFLFDAWVDLYGPEFAQLHVAVEAARRPFYRLAWGWALAMNRPARAAALQRLLSG